MKTATDRRCGATDCGSHGVLEGEVHRPQLASGPPDGAPPPPSGGGRDPHAVKKKVFAVRQFFCSRMCEPVQRRYLCAVRLSGLKREKELHVVPFQHHIGRQSDGMSTLSNSDTAATGTDHSGPNATSLGAMEGEGSMSAVCARVRFKSTGPPTGRGGGEGEGPGRQSGTRC